MHTKLHTTSLQSNAAYPLNGEEITPVTVMVQQGTDAILPPLISPGALKELYFVDWRRNSTSETLVRIEVPRNEPGMTNGRYSVDQDSFALTIQSVQFEDRGLYFGVYKVAELA